MTEIEHADVVVIGGGRAAHEPAGAHKHCDARRVIMLDRAPRAQSGGNARFSGTGFRWAFDDVEELREVTGTTPEEFASVVVKPYTAQMFNDDSNRVLSDRMGP